MGGIVKLEPFTQFPSVGISLGESGSEVFQITAVLSDKVAIFCELGDFTQKAKKRLMVIATPLGLVMFILNSLGLGLVGPLRNTDLQSGSDGATPVGVGISVLVVAT